MLKRLLGDDDFYRIDENIMSLIYIPALMPSRDFPDKEEVMRIIKSMYYDMYYPICKSIKINDVPYVDYVGTLVSRYYASNKIVFYLLEP